MTCGLLRITQLHGLMSPRPLGSVVKACLIFAVIDSNSAHGTHHLHIFAPCIHWCNIVSSAARLPSSSKIVLLAPSKSKPRMHFLSAKVPSPFFQFLFRNGVLSLLSAWGGNIINPMHNPPCHMCHLFCDVEIITVMKSST
jgi:hypothetical protein